MSASHVVSPAAQRDIRDIYEYISRDSPRNAAKVVTRLYDEFGLIARTPGIGHIRPELRDNSLRAISVYKYLVIYDSVRRPLEIIRVIHGAMDLQRQFTR